MKLNYIANKHDRVIAGMVGVALEEKWIELNTSEVKILEEAQLICEKAHQLLQQHYHDDDLITDYGLADHALCDILQDHKGVRE